MKKLLLLCTISIASISLKSQNVFIPDSIFKATLISSHAADKNGDGEIQVSEALLLTAIRVENLGISSLEGVQSFTNLKEIMCQGNKLKSLDIRAIENLDYLICFNNPELISVCIKNIQSYKSFSNWAYDTHTVMNENCSPVTSIYDNQFEIEKNVVATYNLQGQKVETVSNGIYIQVFSDGTRNKIFID
jgi:hypothetical protein